MVITWIEVGRTGTVFNNSHPLPNARNITNAEWAAALSCRMVTFSTSSGYFSLTGKHGWYCRNEFNTVH
jgi:hypothetical protein